MFRFGEFEADAAKLELRRGGSVVELEPKAIRVLLFLIEEREKAVSKEELFEQVWPGVEVTDNALTRVVGQLRKALGDDAKQARYIETVPTVGYRFVGRLDEPKKTSAWKWLWVPAAVAALTVVWLGARTRETTAAIPKGTPRQVTNSRTLDSGPAFSPDGKWLAYSSDRTGQFEIYGKPLDGAGNEIAITEDGGPNIEAAWSPDGKWIAYHCGAKGGICLVPGTGGTVRVLAVPGSQPAWSRDSKKLVYRDAPVISAAPLDLFTVMPYGLAVIDIETGEKKTYGDSLHNRSSPNWSGDGKWLVYSALPKRGPAHVEALRLETGATHEITRVDGAVSALRLSPDQKTLYLARLQKPLDYGIYRVPIDAAAMKATGDAEEITRANSLPMQLEVSRDGKRLAIGMVEIDSNLFRIAIDEQGATKGEPLPVTQNRNFRNSAPMISPDGTKIVRMTRQLGTPPQIWMSNLDGSEDELLSEPTATALAPNWTEDGSAVIYWTPGETPVEMLRLADRTRKKFRFDRPHGALARYSGRGNEMLLHELRGREFYIGFQNFETGAMRWIDTGSTQIAFAQSSGDGSRLVAEKFDRGFTHLVTLPAGGGKATQLTDGIEQAWAYSWSPDAKKIAFAGMRQGSWNLFAIDAETRAEKQLTKYKSMRTFVRYPSWSPRNDWMVYEATETTGNLFLLELEAR